MNRKTGPLQRIGDSRRHETRREVRVEGTGGPWPALLKALIGALLVARLLVPTESTAQGETLWLVQLWLLAGVFWGWLCFREGTLNGVIAGRQRLPDRGPAIIGSFNWCDAAVVVLAGAHVISAISVVVTDGHKRAAVNMAWEWVGLAAAFYLLRRVLQTAADRQRLLLVMFAAATALAGLGLWQHYVSLPQTVQDYQKLRGELTRLEAAPPAETAVEAERHRRRINELKHELSARGIPLEGPARKAFEQRLQASEPFAFFALSNTLGGLLAAWLAWAMTALLEDGRQRRYWRRLAAWLLPLAVVGFCLVLTKSRTAWTGLLAGLAVWGCLRWNQRGGFSRRTWLTGILASVVLLAGFVGVAALSGGFDRKVLSEAPKSLQYRFQYWTGTWRVIQEFPLLGAGPGNFRPHYLRHKLPESSEEITDPHNFVFDLWVNGGVLAVVAFGAFLTVARRAIRRTDVGDAESGEPRAKRGRRKADSQLSTLNSQLSVRDPLAVGAGTGFLLVPAAQWLSGELPDTRLLAVFVGWMVALGLLVAGAGIIRYGGTPLVAAGAALLVHLLGAGGIEMPAVTLTLLVFVAAGAPLQGSSEPVPQRSHAVRLFPLGVLLLLFFGCYFSATGPVLQRRSLLRLGDAAVSLDGNVRQARADYQRAADCDPLSPEPLQRLAGLAFREWQASSNPEDGRFRRAVALQRRAIAQNPHSPHGYRELGEWHLRRFERIGETEDALHAAEAFQEAVRRYPTNAALRAELARAWDAAGRTDQAQREAERALELDRINRKHGHADKYLPQPAVRELRRLDGSAKAGNRIE